MNKSTVTSKGQTTIPRTVREELGIRRGDVLEWDIQQRLVRLRLVGRGFLCRRGMIRTGPGSAANDIARARKGRGSAKA
ncbi:MAG: AbrB/MazE/SpoVT family DNA-binding domain-containing protein [Acidobacteriota bacterium]